MIRPGVAARRLYDRHVWTFLSQECLHTHLKKIGCDVACSLQPQHLARLQLLHQRDLPPHRDLSPDSAPQVAVPTSEPLDRRLQDRT